MELTIEQALQGGVAAHKEGNLQDAERLYRAILRSQPLHPDANHNLGVLAVSANKAAEALPLFKTALDANPKMEQFWLSYVDALIKEQQFDTAKQTIKKAKKQGFAGDKLDVLQAQLTSSADGKVPPQAATTNLLEYYQAGRYGDAEKHALSITEEFPEHPFGWKVLGAVLKQTDRLDASLSATLKSVQFAAKDAEAHCNLGITLQEIGRLDEAEASLRQAIGLKPDYAKAHYNLGVTLQELGRLQEAEESYRQSLAFKPDNAKANNNLGVILKVLGRLQEAEESLRQAIALKADNVEAYNNLGATLQELGRLDEAKESYKNAIAIKPNYAEPHINIGTIFQRAGSIEEALQEFDTAISLRPEKEGWLIRRALSLPVIVSSLEHIKTIRTNLIDAVQELQDRGVSVTDPYLDINLANFDLAYHSEDNKGIAENVARLHISACPELTYEAKHCNFAYARKPGRVRIGFLSSYLRHHTIGKLYKGIIEHFSKNQFEVIFFKFTTRANKITDAIESAANKVVPLYKNLDRDRDVIAAEELDILFYPDIGMDPYTYFLSFARLAPVQAVSWGHPDTTGIPNMDYFISSDLLEQRGTSDQYTEQLIQLSTLPTYYYRPKPPQETYTHSDFGLPKGCPLYVCPQTLFKLHPSFDALAGEILRQDRRGHLVLVGDEKYKNREKLILKRYARLYPDVIERILFVPFMPSDKYLTLLRLADVILDVPSFSGGNSSLEAFAMGAPIVTWPGNFMRSRVTAGFYKMMGLDDLIAADDGEYVSLALKLAHDADFKCRMQAAINSNSEKLFERIEVVREMETFFLEAHKSSQNGEILNNIKFRNILDNSHV